MDWAPINSEESTWTIIILFENLLTLNILLYGIDIVDGNIVGELARRKV